MRELFVKVLGYVLNPDVDYNLITEQKNEKDSKKADGAILNGLSVIAVIELKSTKTVDLATIESQAFGYKNNQQACKYVITSNFRKLRFYIDNAVDFEEFDLFNLSSDQFKLLWICLSATHLLKNIPAQIKEASNHEEENVTKKLYADYAKFRTDFFQNIILKNPDFDRLVLFKKTQKLLDRFLFLFFAEDRGLVSPNWTRKILQDWTDLKDKYDNYIPLYNRFRKNFDYLNTGYSGKDGEIFAYNGGLFAPDDILDSLTIDDDLLYKGSLKLSNYDFESEVDVNILGHIFEHSLNEIDEIQASLMDEKTEKVSKRKKDGVFYTPKYITKYIVENTIGTLCKAQKEKLDIIDEEFEFIDAKAKGKDKTKRETLNQKITDYRNWLLALKIVDPACGSGAFLNQALEFLIAEHTKLDELKATLLGGSLVLSDVENSILENNLYGVDINEEAVEIAKLSLWLRTARKGRKLNSLNQNLKCGNSLIDDIDVAGDKAFNWNNEFKEVFEKGGFDVVIGNPPYVVYIKSVVGDAIINFILKKYNYSEYNPNTYALFTELAIVDILKSKGQLGFIIPSSWLDNKYFSKMRSGVYSQNVRQIIDLKNTAFDEIVETVILILDKDNEGKEVTIIPSFNATKIDEQTLDVSILQNGINPFIKINNAITEKLEKQSKIGDNSLVYRGLETRDNSKWISFEKKNESHKPILLGKDVNRYSTYYSGSYVNFVKKEMKSNANEDFYVNKKILMRRTGNKITTDIDLSGYFVLKNCYLIIPKDSFIYSILAQLNSKLLGYYHKMQSSGENKAFAQFKGEYVSALPCIKSDEKLEREFEIKVKLLKEMIEKENEVLNSFNSILLMCYPYVKQSEKFIKWNDLTSVDFFKELEKQKIKLSLSEQAEWLQYFEEQKAKALAIKTQREETDKEIDRMVYELYELTEDEIRIVEGI